jgi:chloramphenicol-sensitive protein RarD
MSQHSAPSHGPGLPYALGAQIIWGLLPLYLRLVHVVPAFEFVSWRVLFTLPFCLLFIVARQQLRELITALTTWAVLRMLVISALLIATNWLIYVYAIQSGQVYAASFGYYVAPLLQVLAGTVILKERLSPRQWTAVALSCLGVVVLGWKEIGMLGISLAMALSWVAYGFVRKIVPVGSVPGLTVETMVLAPLAAIGALWFSAAPGGSSFGHDFGLSILIACSGLVTAVPLVLFAIAARRIDFTVLGMLQFSSPTLVFLLGVIVFHKPLDQLQLASFGIIWTAIGLFVWDLLSRRRLPAAA